MQIFAVRIFNLKHFAIYLKIFLIQPQGLEFSHVGPPVTFLANLDTNISWKLSSSSLILVAKVKLIN